MFKKPEDYGLQVHVVDVSPQLAKEWLGANRHNRREKPFMVTRYARDIREDQWLLTGEPIIFDNEGALRNGQNRLRACIEANTNFTVLVVRGVDPAAFRVMDTGSARTYADVLSIWNPDMQNYTALGAAAACVWRWENGHRIVGGGQALNPTHAEVLDTVGRHPRLDHSVEMGTRGGRNAVIRPPRIAAYLHYRFSLDDPESADRFLGLLTSRSINPETAQWEVKDGGRRDEPLSLLADALGRMEQDKSHRDAHKVLYYAIKTWRVWRGIDKPVQRLLVGQFPQEVPITPAGRAWAWGEG